MKFDSIFYSKHVKIQWNYILRRSDKVLRQSKSEQVMGIS